MISQKFLSHCQRGRTRLCWKGRARQAAAGCPVPTTLLCLSQLLEGQLNACPSRSELAPQTALTVNAHTLSWTTGTQEQFGHNHGQSYDAEKPPVCHGNTRGCTECFVVIYCNAVMQVPARALPAKSECSPTYGRSCPYAEPKNEGEMLGKYGQGKQQPQGSSLQEP